MSPLLSTPVAVASNRQYIGASLDARRDARRRLKLPMDAKVRDWSNFSLLRHRRFDGFIVSLPNSGTHWLRFLLAMLICRHWEVEPPAHLNDNSVVGHPKSPPLHAHIPRLVHSHNIPSPLVHGPPLGLLFRFPPYIILLRDMRASLVSHYEKWKEDYDVSFSEFLRGDPSGRRFWKDIWWELRFLNAWGRVCRLKPSGTLVVRYEALRSAPAETLAEIWRFLGQPVLAESDFEAAVAASSKDRMAQMQTYSPEHRVVRKDTRPTESWFSPADRQFFTDTCVRELRHSFGYDYGRWEAV